jgi:O-antigen ligase
MKPYQENKSFAERIAICDLLPYCYIIATVFLLSRFENGLLFRLNQIPFPGFVVFQLTIIVSLLLYKGRLYTVRYNFIVNFIACITISSIVSTLTNELSIDSIVLFVQSLLYLLLPILSSLLIIDSISDDVLFCNTYILCTAVIIPLFIIVTAISPEIFGNILGWTEQSVSQRSLLHSAFSPLGTRISSGLLVLSSFIFLIPRYIVFRKKYHLVLIILSFSSVLFTLSRTVMVQFFLMLLFSGSYILVVLPLRLFRNYLIAILLFFIVSIALISMTQYRYQRFILTGDTSMNLRILAIKNTFNISLSKPLFGYGPGLFFTINRTAFVDPNVHIDKVYKQKFASMDNIGLIEPHNTYVYFALEYGYIALIIYILFFLKNIKNAMRIKEEGEFYFFISTYKALYFGFFVAFLFTMYVHSIVLVSPKVSFFVHLCFFSYFLKLNRSEPVPLEVPNM